MTTTLAAEIWFYVFRHGETDWNKERRFQGHTDIPLNENGRAQAQTLTEAINRLRPDVILCSDLIRARQTADIANADWHAPVFYSEALRECNLGATEGMLADNVLGTFGEEAWARFHSPKPEDEDFGFPNGETHRQHAQRLQQYMIQHALQNPRHRKIAVSTHGNSVRRLISKCENAPLESFPVPNCALFTLAYHPSTGVWRLQT